MSRAPERQIGKCPLSQQRESEPVVENRDKVSVTSDETLTEEEDAPPVLVQTQEEQDLVDRSAPADYPATAAPSSDGEDVNLQPRKSTRARKPTQMLTYESLGQPSYQPSYQPPLDINTVAAWVPPALPLWRTDTTPVVCHPPVSTVSHPIPYSILPYTPAMQYATPLILH